LKDLALEDVGLDIVWPFGLFYGHLVYFWPFGIFYGYLVYFTRFGMLYQEKYGNPDQIGRIFSHWALDNFFANFKRSPIVFPR
jgi:hypothetical protein